MTFPPIHLRCISFPFSLLLRSDRPHIALFENQISVIHKRPWLADAPALLYFAIGTNACPLARRLVPFLLVQERGCSAYGLSFLVNDVYAP